MFAWDACDAPRIDPDFICHHFNINPSVTPKKQSPQRPSREHAEAIREEVTKLKRAGAIKEVFYLEWLANTVVVKKKSRKRRVCVDFTDLNKTCPKDPFPMPRIDQLVDATIGHPRMSFLDAFQGYHQIPLALEDQEKTALSLKHSASVLANFASSLALTASSLAYMAIFFASSASASFFFRPTIYSLAI